MKNTFSLSSATKRLTLFFVTAAVAAFAFGQSPLAVARKTVGNADILKNWDLGETKYLNNANILRVAGENDIEHRTNLFYTSCQSIMNYIEGKAPEERLSEKLKEARADCNLKEAVGGRLSLFFDRNKKSLADPSLFQIVVKSEAGEVIFAQALDFERPSYFKWGIWYHYTTVSLPVNVGEKFSVEIADAGLMRNFIFQVVNWEDNGEDHHLLPIIREIF